MFKGLRALGPSLWLLRRLVRNQEAQLAQTRRLAQACEKIAAALHVRNASGFITGTPDEGDTRELSGMVRSSDADLAQLLYWEQALQQQLGRPPSDEEVVAAWESWKEGMRA